MRKSHFIFLLMLFTVPLKNSYAATAPNVSLNIMGSHKTLNDFKGKLVYIDFWATWCIPCRKSFPFMNELSNKYSNKGLTIIAINLDKDLSRVKPFLKKYPPNFNISYDQSGMSAEKFNVKVMPSSFLIDRNGRIIYSHSGFRKKDVLVIEKTIISNLLKPKESTI